MTFLNNSAAYVWGFAAIFMLVVAAMTYVFIHDGAPAGYSPLFVFGVVTFFWIGGLGLSAFAASKHCLHVTVQPDSSIYIVWRYPFKKKARSVLPAELTPAKVFESRDDEGSPYFRARVTLADTTTIDLAEAHRRESCESTCQRFNAAVWPSSSERNA